MDINISIDEIKAREILDSKGSPALETEVFLEDGTYGIAQVSDSSLAYNYSGTGENIMCVTDAANMINDEISNILCGANTTNQLEIDEQLISVKELPSFASMSVSSACAKAAANALSLPLYRYLGGVYAKTVPLPQMSILDTPFTDCRQLLMQPSGAASLTEAIAIIEAVSTSLKEILLADGTPLLYGEHGGFAPRITQIEDAIELLSLAICKAGFIPGEDAEIIMSVCASSHYMDGKYYFGSESRSTEEQIIRLTSICEKYPIAGIDDPFSSYDIYGWQTIQETIGDFVLIAGDELFRSDACNIKAKENYAGCAIIRAARCGVVSDVFEAAAASRSAGRKVIIGDSGGTAEDTFAADMSLAVNADIIKLGAPGSAGSTSTLNQLIRIEEELGGTSVFSTEIE